mmetsp:Transcript_8797/g.17651  ORF Transcript_8797/g.17651 Transcript_8797/m.17651 type:complete len:352 (-) Transcript_8797:136-1191(-)
MLRRVTEYRPHRGRSAVLHFLLLSQGRHPAPGHIPALPTQEHEIQGESFSAVTVPPPRREATHPVVRVDEAIESDSVVPIRLETVEYECMRPPRSEKLRRAQDHPREAVAYKTGDGRLVVDLDEDDGRIVCHFANNRAANTPHPGEVLADELGVDGRWLAVLCENEGLSIVPLVRQRIMFVLVVSIKDRPCSLAAHFLGSVRERASGELLDGPFRVPDFDDCVEAVAEASRHQQHLPVPLPLLPVKDHVQELLLQGPVERERAVHRMKVGEVVLATTPHVQGLLPVHLHQGELSADDQGPGRVVVFDHALELEHLIVGYERLRHRLSAIGRDPVPPRVDQEHSDVSIHVKR